MKRLGSTPYSGEKNADGVAHPKKHPGFGSFKQRMGLQGSGIGRGLLPVRKGAEMTVSRGMKKEISEEIGDLLVDVARLADFMGTQGKLWKLADPRFQKWFGTVENQVETLPGLVEEIHCMLQPGEENPLRAVKIMPPRFDKV